MRYLLMLCGVLVLLCGCGQVAPTPTAIASLASLDPTPAEVIQAFRDAGLRDYPDEKSTTYDKVNQPGLVRYQVFYAKQAAGDKHVVAEYDTVADAEAARAAITDKYRNSFRRGKLVLVWWGEGSGPYFTILQTMNR